MERSEWQKILRSLSLLTQLGLAVVANMGVGFFLGYLAGDFFGHELLFRVAGLILGIGSGFYSDYRLIKRIIGDDNDDDW